MNILVLNCGSSSAKFAVIDTRDGQVRISGIAQRLGSPQASLDWKNGGTKHSKALPGAGHDAALREVVELLRSAGLADSIGGIGHRVVHAGDKFSASMAVTPAVVQAVEECITLSPLHNPPNLLGIQIAQELFPRLPQVAVFDTAFHQTMPPRAYVYPVPHAWLEKYQVRRYGFHGTSHRFVSQQAIKQLGLSPSDNALITAHLGNGCSCAAVRNGKCVDTTMGLTPLEGVMMDKRSGTIDPSIISHMKKALNCTAHDVMDQLTSHSGLLGISGLSNDMLTLERAAREGHERARLAIEKFCYSVAKQAAGMFVSLGRVDALVFTGGIGENQVEVRAQIVELLRFSGLVLDPKQNAVHGRGASGRITRSTSPMAAVIPTNEEYMIAQDTAEIVTRDGHLHERWARPLHAVDAVE
jgi:acetate kinase